MFIKEFVCSLISIVSVENLLTLFSIIAIAIISLGWFYGIDTWWSTLKGFFNHINIVTCGVSASVGVAFVFGVCLLLMSICEKSFVKMAFKNGQQQISFEKPVCYINRSDLVRDVGTLSEPDGFYYFFSGPHGCGKTTVLMEAVSLFHTGVLYHHLDGDDYLECLASAFSIDFACTSSSSPFDYLETIIKAYRKKCPNNYIEKLQIILDIVTTVAREMKVNKENVPTLIIDNFNAVIHPSHGDLGKQVVHSFQSFAKEMADERLMTIIFSGSEGRLLDVFFEESAVSRMRVYEPSPDIPLPEAVAYLKCRCPNRAEDAAKVVELVGGRLIHLGRAARSMIKGNTFEIVKKQLFSLVLEELSFLEISQPSSTSSALSNATWKLADEILNSKEKQISLMEFLHVQAKFLHVQSQISKERIKMLVEANIFLIAIRHKHVLFQSTFVQSYFKQNLEQLD